MTAQFGGQGLNNLDQFVSAQFREWAPHPLQMHPASLCDAQGVGKLYMLLARNVPIG